MNDLVVRVIDRRHGERRNRIAINIDAGVSRVVRREAKAPALFVDGLDGDSKNDLLAAGPAVVRADPVRGIIKARYRDGFTDNICFVLIRIVVIAPRRRVAVSVDGGAGLGVNLNRLGICPVRVQIKILRNGVLEDGRCRQRDACAADLLTDLLEDACQVSTGCRRAVVLGGNRCSSARQACRVRIVGGNIVHVSGRVSFRRGAEAADREDRGSAVFEGLGCGDRAVSNRSFKGVAACRLTVGEHNGDLFAAAVRVRQNGLRKLHTEICPRCAACLQGINCSFQSAGVAIYVCQILNDLRVIVSVAIFLICVISNCRIFRARKLNDGNAIRMRRVRSRICSVNKVLYCEFQGTQLCDINVAVAPVGFIYGFPFSTPSAILPLTVNIAHRGTRISDAGTLEHINALCCAVHCVQLVKVAPITDLNKSVITLKRPGIKRGFFQLFHRTGRIEHQRDIDRLGDDLRLARAGDVGFERQIASLFIIFLMRFDAAGRAVVLRRACRNRYHGQNHNNSQQKR